MVIDWFVFILLSAAAYRITRFFTYDSLIGFNPESESGASYWIDRFAYDKDGKDKSFVKGKLGDLLVCPWCMGWWLSCAVLALWTWSLPWVNGTDPTTWILTAFAIAGVQGFIASRMNA